MSYYSLQTLTLKSVACNASTHILCQLLNLSAKLVTLSEAFGLSKEPPLLTLYHLYPIKLFQSKSELTPPAQSPPARSIYTVCVALLSQYSFEIKVWKQYQRVNQ